ncbi:MAG: T9SS type A sorting domain-containing protein, partial [Bacteroidetes bacterium]|nr:T9SS type A sorting domain-containing protein [Bacteroidota bacterium]
YNTPGSYDVTLIATDGTTIDTLVIPNYISVYPYPAPQGIAQSGDTLIANQGAVSYQWYYNGTLIPGATNYFYVANQSGNFNVVATDVNSCEVEAVIFDVVAGIKTAVGSEQFIIYPNPVAEKLTVSCKKVAINAISIYNQLGQLLLGQRKPMGSVDGVLEVDLTALANGLYWLELDSGEKIIRIKFVKE